MTLPAMTTKANRQGGMALQGVRGVQLTGLSSTDDGTGVRISSGSRGVSITASLIQRSATGVITTADTHNVLLAGVRVAASRTAGFDLGGERIHLTDATVIGAPVAVKLTRTSHDLRVDRSRIINAQIGVQTARASARPMLASISVTDARAVGFLLSSDGATVREAQVKLSGAGIRVVGDVHQSTILNTTVSQSPVGVDLSHTVRSVTIARLRITGASVGVASSAANLRLDHVDVSDTAIGLRLAGSTVVEGTAMDDVVEGIRIRGTGRTELSHVQLRAGKVAIRAAAGSHVVVENSTIRAIQPTLGHVQFRGLNDLPAKRLRWYGLAAVAAAASATTLELIRRLRENKEARRECFVPTHVLNTR